MNTPVDTVTNALSDLKIGRQKHQPKRNHTTKPDKNAAVKHPSKTVPVVPSSSATATATTATIDAATTPTVPVPIPKDEDKSIPTIASPNTTSLSSVNSNHIPFVKLMLIRVETTFGKPNKDGAFDTHRCTAFLWPVLRKYGEIPTTADKKEPQPSAFAYTLRHDSKQRPFYEVVVTFTRIYTEKPEVNELLTSIIGDETHIGKIPFRYAGDDRYWMVRAFTNSSQPKFKKECDVHRIMCLDRNIILPAATLPDAERIQQLEAMVLTYATALSHANQTETLLQQRLTNTLDNVQEYHFDLVKTACVVDDLKIAVDVAHEQVRNLKRKLDQVSDQNEQLGHQLYHHSADDEAY
jgi:hypothetical protein